MKKLIFTICSNNYLPYAFSLYESIRLHTDDFDFCIGLSDRKLKHIDYRDLNIVPCLSLKIFPIKTAILKYNLIEFNTSLKPFLFYNFFTNYDYDVVYYVDPDILFFNNPSLIDKEFSPYNFIITPHALSPVKDDYQPSDFQMIQTGIYNLGFIGMKNSDDTIKFLQWWSDKVINFGHADISRSMFYDQLWANLLPIYFQNTLVSRHLGMNVSSWNLHERLISKNNGSFLVNNDYDLIFYHFAEYKIEQPNILAKFCNRYSLANRKDVLELYNIFHTKLLCNRYFEYINIQNSFFAT